MTKTKISFAVIGSPPKKLNLQKIQRWKSKVFGVENPINSYSLPTNSDGHDWQFTDQNLEKALPEKFSGDFLIGIVNVPLELNWYTRRLKGNRIVFSFHEIKNILGNENIPLENVIYRVMYAFTLVFKSNSNRIPSNDEPTNYTHDDTTGCLFDMNPDKQDVIYSSHRPIVCADCVANLRTRRVSNEVISSVQEEISKIRKQLYYQITEWVKEHPILSLLITAAASLVFGTVTSVIASFIYAAMTTTS